MLWRPRFDGMVPGHACAVQSERLQQGNMPAVTNTETDLRAVLRAEESPEVLTTVGFTIHGESPQLRIEYPRRTMSATFPLAHLAAGLIRAWTRGADLDLSASVVVTVDVIEVDDLRLVRWSTSARRRVGSDRWWARDR
jgi:hypothetical protein